MIYRWNQFEKEYLNYFNTLLTAIKNLKVYTYTDEQLFYTYNDHQYKIWLEFTYSNQYILIIDIELKFNERIRNKLYLSRILDIDITEFNKIIEKVFQEYKMKSLNH